MKDDKKISLQVDDDKEKNTVLVLTERETQCITQALQGKNIAQISENLKISPRTIVYYLNNVKLKIGQLACGITISTT